MTLTEWRRVDGELKRARWSIVSELRRLSVDPPQDKATDAMFNMAKAISSIDIARVDLIELIDLLQEPLEPEHEMDEPPAKRAYTKRAPKVRGRKKGTAPAPGSNPAPANWEGGTVIERIMGIIRSRGPQSPQELQAALGAESIGIVYTGTGILKNRGEIENRAMSDDDPTRRWHLVKGK